MTITSSHPVWEAENYISEVRAEATRVLSRQYAAFDVDDIASDIVLKLLERLDETMTRYPNPVVYANAVCRNQGIDFLRRQRGQRCEGARGGRKVISGDATAEGSDLCIFDILVDEGPLVDDEVLGYLGEAYLAAEIQLGIPADEWEALRLTDVLGFSDAEAAEILGIARETVNRRKNRARKLCKEMRA